MDSEEQPGREPADEPTLTSPSGSRWEPDAAGPDAGSARVGPPGEPPVASARPRRRVLRVVGGVVAALVLAGGGFVAGHAVADDGPGDGGPTIGGHRHGAGPAAGAARRDGDGDGRRGPDGDRDGALGTGPAPSSGPVVGTSA